jgi:hypothetical protein
MRGLDRILDFLTFRRMKRRNRIIASILVVILCALAAYAYQSHFGPDYSKPKAPAQLHSIQSGHEATLMAHYLGPKGGYQHCEWRFYGPIPYKDCAFLLQPGSTKDFDTLLQRNENGTIDSVITSGAFGAMCSWVGLGLIAFICAAIGLWYAHQVVNDTHAAAKDERCLRVRYAIVGLGAPINIRIDAYGEWERWIYFTGPDGLTWRYWGFPTSCKMPADCTGSGCIVVTKGAKTA